MKLSAEVQMFAIALILVTLLAVALAVVALREMPREDEQDGEQAQNPEIAFTPVAGKNRDESTLKTSEQTEAE